jgi:hypothetical protein
MRLTFFEVFLKSDWFPLFIYGIGFGATGNHRAQSDKQSNLLLNHYRGKR